MTPEPVHDSRAPDTEQESEQPSTLLAIAVSRRLLDDLADHLDGDRYAGDVPDLLLRIGAVRAVLRRVHQRLEEE